jgi:hypothetical protein
VLLPPISQALQTIPFEIIVESLNQLALSHGLKTGLKTLFIKWHSGIASSDG